MKNQLKQKLEVTGKIVLKTGLHIGGTNTSMDIGGIDTNVIRNPVNNQPFIPGSSLKGKMRCLLEQSKGTIGGRAGGNVNHGPSGDSSHLSVKLFGNAASGNGKQIPSRVIVRDAYLFNAEDLLDKTEIPYTEGKTEVVIDRVTSAASPRQIERVPAGAKFQMNIVLNIFEGENKEDELIKGLFASLKLLRDDYLGGSGSRGYGQVSFQDIKIFKKEIGYYFEGQKAEDLTNLYEEVINQLR